MNYLNYIITESYHDRQRALWRAVILQAFVDISTNSQKVEDKIAKRFARSWLLGMSEEFKLVCSMAGYNPYYVGKKAVGIMNKAKKSNLNKAV